MYHRAGRSGNACRVSEIDTSCIFLAILLAIQLVVSSTANVRAADEGQKGADKVGRIPAVVFIPTPNDVVARMLDLAAVQKRDHVYDLGCGDGRIVIAAAKRFGCRATGFDVDPIRVEESHDNVKRGMVGDLVRIEQQDIFKLDLRPASVITLYLSPRFNARLIPQLETLRAGSRIVSHQFGIQGVKPDKVVEIVSEEDGRQHTIYLWTTPLRRQE